MDDLFQLCAKECVQIISRLNPKSLLLIGPEENPDLKELININFNGRLNCIVNADPIRKLDAGERYDLVYLYGLEKFDKQTGLHLIASLRDIHAMHLFVVIPCGRQWDTQDFRSEWLPGDLIACGMHQHRLFGEAGRQLLLYRFELSDYKTTPDWLNSKYWANPELFDKYRW